MNPLFPQIGNAPPGSGTGVVTQTFSEGNLKCTGNTGGGGAVMMGTMSVPGSGKWYYECLWQANTNNRLHVGVTYGGTTNAILELSSNRWSYLGYSSPRNGSDSWGWRSDSGINHQGSTTLTTEFPAYSVGDILQIALDLDNNKLYFGKNGTWQNSGDPTSGATGTGAVSVTSGQTDWNLGCTQGSDAANKYLTAIANYGQDSSFAGEKTAQGNGGAGVDFYYDPPSGYKALCTDNLPTPLIALPGDNFNTVLYTGDGSTSVRQAITSGFATDMAWNKSRSGSGSWLQYDTVRGDGYKLASDTTAAQVDVTGSGNGIAFTSTGINIGASTTGYNDQSNESGVTYASWQWKAGGAAAVSKTYTVTTSASKFYLGGIQQPTLELREGSTYTFDTSDATVSGHTFKFATAADAAGSTEYTTGVTETGTPGSAGAKTVIVVAASAPALFYYCSNHSSMGGSANTNTTAGSSNFDGTIASAVSANPTAGFSIVSYTGSGSAGTVGHGLSVAPDMVIVKKLSAIAQWPVAVIQDPMNFTDYMALDKNNNAGDFDYWNDTPPTASVFSLSGDGDVNQSTGTYITYCFHSVEGYSKVGSYAGNGNVDGTFIYTGFRPAMVIIKNMDSSGHDWLMFDDKRDTYNMVTQTLFPDAGDAEASASTGYDFTSNGFKARSTAGNKNTNGDRYLYIAFAQSPFKTSNAR